MIGLRSASSASHIINLLVSRILQSDGSRPSESDDQPIFECLDSVPDLGLVRLCYEFFQRVEDAPIRQVGGGNPE